MVMLWQGWETAKEIKGGNRLHQQTDPAKAGYQEEVLATPSRLVGQLDANGHLADMVLLTAPDQKGGNAVFIPSTLVVERDGQTLPLFELYEKSGWPAVVDSIGRFMGAGFTQTALMSADQAQKLLASAGTLTVDNTDAVVVEAADGTKSTAFEAGPITLTPEEAVKFMTVTGVGESPVQRSYRQQLVWQSWLDKVKANPSLLPTVAPLGQGDGAIDISAVVKALTEGQVSTQPLPVIRIPLARESWAADPDSMGELVSRVLPFPSASYPGQRPRVRILDGTENRELILKATAPIVSAGGQITIIGNADRFGVPATKIEYHDPSQQAAAEKIAAALGNRQAVSSSDQTDTFDVTVTLGSDYTG
jgi:LytR cell envelope-related transcriptional attenuator